MAFSACCPSGIDPMVSPEKTAADRARNRRVEVSLDFSS